MAGICGDLPPILRYDATTCAAGVQTSPSAHDPPRGTTYGSLTLHAVVLPVQALVVERRSILIQSVLVHPPAVSGGGAVGEGARDLDPPPPLLRDYANLLGDLGKVLVLAEDEGHVVVAAGGRAPSRLSAIRTSIPFSSPVRNECRVPSGRDTPARGLPACRARSEERGASIPNDTNRERQPSIPVTPPRMAPVVRLTPAPVARYPSQKDNSTDGSRSPGLLRRHGPTVRCAGTNPPPMWLHRIRHFMHRVPDV